MSQCYGRAFLQDDPWYLSVFGGFCSGLSLMVEHSKRRVELCLYVIPRALEILMRLVPKKMKFLYEFFRWKPLPILTFQSAIALWMTLMAVKGGRKYSNGLNMTVLTVVFGSKH